jgi:hypothetical protein
MAHFAARAIISLIFGFLIYEALNEFNKLFGLSLNPYLALTIVPAGLVYVFQEFVIKKLRANEKVVPINKPMNTRIDKVWSIFTWVLLSIFLIFILVIWAGAIYKQSIREYSDYTTTIQ